MKAWFIVIGFMSATLSAYAMASEALVKGDPVKTPHFEATVNRQVDADPDGRYEVTSNDGTKTVAIYYRSQLQKIEDHAESAPKKTCLWGVCSSDPFDFRLITCTNAGCLVGF